MDPLVSVCIPTYNRARCILRAVRSALSQTYRRVEVLVSDNASTDATMELLSTIKDDRVTIHRQPRNLGPERNIQWLLAHASGDYFVVLSSDDYWEPEMLEVAVRRMEQEPDVGVHCTKTFYETESGQIVALGPRMGAWGKLRDAEILLRGNFVVFSSAVFRARCYDAVGPVALHPALDMLLWLRIMLHGWAIWLESMPLAHYTLSHDADSIRLKDPDVLKQLNALLREAVIAAGRSELLRHIDSFMAWRYYGLGMHFRTHGDLESARYWYCRALSLHPWSIKARARLLFSYLPPAVELAIVRLCKKIVA